MPTIRAVPSEPEEPDEGRQREPFDPYDPATYRVNGLDSVEVEKVLTTVPVRKPKSDEFFRVHPDLVADMHMLVRDSGMDKEHYLVLPPFTHLVAQRLRPVRLRVAITKYGDVFLWPIRLAPDDDTRLHRMADSALQAAEQAKTLWVRMEWSKGLGAWEMVVAKGDLGDPQWPPKSLRDLIEIAFRDKVVNCPDHQVIRELAGEL